MRSGKLDLFATILVALVVAFVVRATPVTTEAGIAAAVYAPSNALSERQTGTLTTTTSSLLPENANLFNLDNKTQLVTVKSDPDNSVRVCVTAVAIPTTPSGSTDTCAENCAAVGAGVLTCSGGAADGEWIDPGETLPLRYTGKFCICAEAESGTPLVQAKRIAR